MASKAVARKDQMVEGEQKLTFIDIAYTVDSLNLAIEECGDDQERRDSLVAGLQRMILEAAPHKLDGIGHYLKNEEAQIEALKATKKAADKKIAQHQRAIDRMRNLLHWGLLKMNLPKLAGRITTVSLCPGVKGDAEVTDEKNLPTEYWMVIPEQVIPRQVVPDLDKITAALKAGKEVPGARRKQGDDYIRIT